MQYEVRLQPLAEKDLDQAYHWAAANAPATARRWLDKFAETIKSLSSNPERCGFAPEHQKLKRELRQLQYGRRPNVFRVVFLVEGSTVRVLRIRRAAQRFLRRSELE